MIKTHKFLLTAILLMVILTIFSCKKVVDKLPETEAKLDTANSTLVDRYYDSVYLYALQTYYWYNKLTAYEKFLPRKYKTADTIKGLSNEIFAFTRLAINPSAGKSYEQAVDYDSDGNEVDDNEYAKYSYLMYTKNTRNGGIESSRPVIFDNDFTKKMKMTLDGKENSLGFTIGFIPVRNTYPTVDSIHSANKDSVVTFVRLVTKNSPAYHAGLKRGDLISKINGKSLNYDNNLNEIIAALNADNISLTTYKPSTATEKTLSFNKKLYQFDPFFKDTVITVNNKKIGYFAYKSFTDYDSSSKAPFEKIINRLTSEGINDLVVDLRYNGGGAVYTAANIIDYLAPSSANGRVMMTNYYNDLLQTKKATILKNLPQRDDNDNPIAGKTYFDYDYSVNGNTDHITKQGSINLTNIYFIVSSSTASASEMLINSLKPYMNVKLIGASFSDYAKHTYGKPIGFFEIRVGPFSMWISNFETKNANGSGEYYAGINTDDQAFDDVRYDFGNPNERCFRQAIRYIIGDMNYTPPVSGSLRSGSIRSNPADISSMKGVFGIPLGEVTPIRDMVIDPGKNK